MQVMQHPSHDGPLVMFEGDQAHESILQRIARRLPDNKWLTVFRMETMNILKRLGYETPTLFEHYTMQGKYTPFAHQRVTTKFLMETYRGWCLNGMRSGKTSSTAWALDALLQFGEAKRVLILAPLSIMETSWAREIFYANPQRTVYVANRSIAKLRSHVERARPDVVIMNHDKLRFLPNWINEVLDPDIVVVDEATGFKDHTSDRYRAMETLMSKKRRLWCLTGTPCPTGPEDVWAMSRFINPNTPSSLTRWRQMTTMNVNGRYIPLKDCEDTVAELLQPAIRFRTQDCIDMPAQTYHSIKVPMTKDQTSAYKDMLNNMRTEYDGQSVTAANAAVRVFKLLQIAAGIVLDDKGEEVIIGAMPRINECRRLIDQAEGKVIIISPFTAVQKYIVEKLSKWYGCCLVNGTVTGTARTNLFDDFQNTDNHRVMVAHPAVIQYGLTLSAASMSIWWTGTFRTEHFIQANERMRGPDTHKTGVYMMESTALERRVYKQVQTNSVRNDTIVDMFLATIEDEDL